MNGPYLWHYQNPQQQWQNYNQDQIMYRQGVPFAPGWRVNELHLPVYQPQYYGLTNTQVVFRNVYVPVYIEKTRKSTTSRKKTKINESEVKSFFENNHHNFTRTKEHFGIGFNRLKRIIEGRNYLRKTTPEHDRYICRINVRLNYVSTNPDSVDIGWLKYKR